jgi:hypothetical protein
VNLFVEVCGVLLLGEKDVPDETSIEEEKENGR